MKHKKSPRYWVVFLALTLTGLSGCASNRAKYEPVVKAEDAKKDCTSAREFITAHEFLRSHSEFAYPEADARKLALEVSKGCAGAASRFVRVSSLLLKAGAGSRDAVSTGVKFASFSDKQASTLIEVFSGAFLADGLDLSFEAAMKLALSLSSEFKGDADVARSDFNKFLAFCVKADSLDLPRPTCAQVGARLAKKSEATEQSVYQPFLTVYDFLRSSKGPGLNVADTIAVAEEVIAGGRVGVDSFIQAYRYAVSTAGLGYSTEQALQFAKKMAAATVPAKT